MKNYVVYLLFVFCLCFTRTAEAKFPIHLGGFTIGDDLALYEDKIDAAYCGQSIYNIHLGECRIKPLPGFKSGQIAYGMCDRPNKILRIKLKFNDDSRKFFNTLFKRYKKELGEPTEYKGDPFQTLIAWKWSFTNEQNQRLSLILQHNTAVEDEKMGNVVKLTLIDQTLKERDCYYKKNPATTVKPPAKPSKKELWRSFIPY